MNFKATGRQPAGKERKEIMALKGKKPTAIEKRFKALFYGLAGVGKTIQSIQFPRPYLIDTERGAENEQYVKLLEKSGGAYLFTNDPDELINEVRELISTKHPYKTLVIDPLTTVYNDLLDRWATALATTDDPTGTSFSRHKGPADRKIKHLLNLLTRLDMNIIITSHAKVKWERSDGKIVEAGLTFDTYSKIDYLFDLVLQVEQRGEERVATVTKTRLGNFPLNAVVPFSYDEIAERYGRDILERDAVPVPLATPEQTKQLAELLSKHANGKDLLEKWLDKAQAASIEEMAAEAADKCIAFLQKAEDAKSALETAVA
jgi:hypothetical protein